MSGVRSPHLPPLVTRRAGVQSPGSRARSVSHRARAAPRSAPERLDAAGPRARYLGQTLLRATPALRPARAGSQSQVRFSRDLGTDRTGDVQSHDRRRSRLGAGDGTDAFVGTIRVNRDPGERSPTDRDRDGEEQQNGVHGIECEAGEETRRDSNDSGRARRSPGRRRRAPADPFPQVIDGRHSRFSSPMKMWLRQTVGAGADRPVPVWPDRRCFSTDGRER